MNLHPLTAPVSTDTSNQDPIAICHRLAGYDFPWDLNRALELAVLRTFCVPRISVLLQQTGEFTHRPQKRYDDTGLILGNILKWGYDSPQGRSAIAQMNRIHRQFDISNEDFLYVLSILIYEPVRWNQRFAVRPFTEVEKQALFDFWRAVGERMAITDLPATYADFEAFNQAYEAQYFRYSPSNQHIGDAVVALMKSWVPTIAAPLIPPIVNALVDQSLRTALGWSRPLPGVRWLLTQSLRRSRQWLSRLPQRRQPAFLVDAPTRTYPDGYVIDQLGPTTPTPTPPPSRCPFLQLRSRLKIGV